MDKEEHLRGGWKSCRGILLLADKRSLDRLQKQLFQREGAFIAAEAIQMFSDRCFLTPPSILTFFFFHISIVISTLKSTAFTKTILRPSCDNDSVFKCSSGKKQKMRVTRALRHPRVPQTEPFYQSCSIVRWSQLGGQETRQGAGLRNFNLKYCALWTQDAGGSLLPLSNFFEDGQRESNFDFNHRTQLYLNFILIWSYKVICIWKYMDLSWRRRELSAKTHCMFTSVISTYYIIGICKY